MTARATEDSLRGSLWPDALPVRKSRGRTEGQHTGILMTQHEFSDPASLEPTAARTEPRADRASIYVARILQQHLVDDPDARHWTRDGTAVCVDISGFTKLS